MQAARLEATDAAKKRVLLRALERIPQSVRLWRAAVEISDEDDARILLVSRLVDGWTNREPRGEQSPGGVPASTRLTLPPCPAPAPPPPPQSRAVECCPQHVELWLALARLESYDNARKVLNKARQAFPTSAEVWISASKLEESHGNEEMPGKVIVPRALKSLAANGVVIDREWWLKEAEAAEKSAPPFVATCRALVAGVVGHGVEAADRKLTWVADAEEALKRGAVETARAIYAHALSVFPGGGRGGGWLWGREEGSGGAGCLLLAAVWLGSARSPLDCGGHE